MHKKRKEKSLIYTKFYCGNVKNLKVFLNKVIMMLIIGIVVKRFQKLREEEVMKKKLLALLLSTACVMSLAVGCGSKEDEAGKVYYLNFKPEAE